LHEEILGSGGINPTFLTSALDGVNGQLYPRGKAPPLPMGWETGNAAERVWMLWEIEYF
jgi:hypothetical protein